MSERDDYADPAPPPGPPPSWWMARVVIPVLGSLALAAAVGACAVAVESAGDVWGVMFTVHENR